MPADALQRVSAAHVAAVLVGVGLLGVGHGPLNGDAAVYAHQALQLDLTQRTIHIGYIAPAAVLGLVFGSWLPLVLDLVNLAAAGLAVWMVGRLGARQGGSGTWSAAWMALGILPLAPFAEVDGSWLALLIGSVLVRSQVAGVGLLAWAIAVSPTALLAVPWVMLSRVDAADEADKAAERDGVSLATGVTVLVLVLLNGGDWLHGDRGVLHAQGIIVGDTIWAWITSGLPVLALLVALQRRWPARAAWATLFLLSAPTDLPSWLLAWAALSIETDRIGLRPRALLAAGTVLSVVGLVDHVVQVRWTQKIVTATARTVGPRDGLVAPWTWGVRVSLEKTGDPYALNWRPLDHVVRDQADRWCGERFERIVVLPPRQIIRVPVAFEEDELGIRWAPGDLPLWYVLPGCPGANAGGQPPG